MTPPTAQPPMVIDDRYRVERLLGAGGMGAVYACKHTGTRRACAVKVILAEAARRPQALERFMREASAQGAVKSPNVVDIFDVGLDRATGNAFMAMELLSGEDLSKSIEGRGKMAPELVLRVASQALTGLAAAHEAGVVHRDLKPANLFLAKTGRGERTVKLLDFGIAKVLEDNSAEGGKLTRTGMVFGSPSYMSPEQASGAPNIDHRSDIWSFGAVMYEALTGSPPYSDSRTLQELIMRIWAGPPESLATLAPQIPADVTAIVTRAMTHDMNGRYQSALEMLEAVNRLLPTGSTITDGMLGVDIAGATAAAGPTGQQTGSTGQQGGQAGSGQQAGSGTVALAPVLSGDTGAGLAAGAARGATVVPAISAAPGGTGTSPPGNQLASAPGGTPSVPGALGGSTQGAFSRTGETAPARRWVLVGGIGLAVAAGLVFLGMQLSSRSGPTTSASGVPDGPAVAPTTTSAAATTITTAAPEPTTATAPATTTTTTTTTTKTTTTSVGPNKPATVAPRASAKPTSTNPFGEKPH